MKKDLISWGICGFETILTISQTNEVFQIVQIILTCISTLIVMAFTIWKWYKKAKEDGVITPDEIDEVIDELKGEKDNGKNKQTKRTNASDSGQDRR